MISDEHGSYNDLAGVNKLKRVNHSKAYQTEGGTNTNQVESFFSRVQRAYPTNLCELSRTADRRFAIWVCGALAATPRKWIPFAFCMKSPAFPVGTSVAELFAITFRLMGRTHELLQQAA